MIELIAVVVFVLLLSGGVAWAAITNRRDERGDIDFKRRKRK